MALTIIIKYNSIWKTSFLAGSNDEPVKKERKFVASIHELKKSENRLERNITVNTIMGVLNRLIGDQRKLYQARQDPNYYFKHLETVLKPKHIVEQAVHNDEMIRLQNLSSGFDKRLMAGIYSDSHPAFTNQDFTLLWHIAFLPLEKVLQFIFTGDLACLKEDKPMIYSPVDVADQLDDLAELKPIEIDSSFQKAINVLSKHFTDVTYAPTSSGKFRPLAFYCSAMYLALEKLEQDQDVTPVLSPRGGISGISKRNFTRPDFLLAYANGQRRKTFNTPYIIENRIKDKGLVRKKLTTANGTVSVHLPISNDKASELVNLIRCAGVGPFKLGKKGLAYIQDMRINQQSVYTPSGHIS